MKVTRNKKVENGFIMDIGKNGNIGFGYGPVKPPKKPLEILLTEVTIRLMGVYESEPLYGLVINGAMCEPMPLDFIIDEIKAYFKEATL